MSTWKIIWNTIKLNPLLYTINAILDLFRFGLLLVPGLVIREIFNKFSNNAPVDWGFWALIAILIGAASSRFIFVLGSIQLGSQLYSGAVTLWRKNIFEYLLNRPDAGTLPFPIGNIINRLNNDIKMVGQFVPFIFFLTGVTIEVTIGTAIMMVINPFVTLIVLIPLVVAGIFLKFGQAQLENNRRKARETDSKVSAFLGEVFGAVDAVQVASAESRVIKHYQKLNEKRREAAIKDRIFSSIFLNSLMENTASISLGLVLLLIAPSIRAGSFSVGDLALFAYFLSRLSGFASILGQTLAAFRQSEISLERLTELLPKEEGLKLIRLSPTYLHGELPGIGPITKTELDSLDSLQIQNLTYNYPGTNKGIRDISLQVKKGSLVVITGKVGSGKTTLLRVLLGLLPKTAGEISWNSRIVEKPTEFLIPPRSAYTGQLPSLFSESVKENILLGLSETDALKTALHKAVLEEDIATFEKGLETLAGRKGVKLSGGQLQRIAAARMLVQETELLVFDDISSALDVNTERLFWQRLREDKTATCLVVSHSKVALRQADHIIVLDNGMIEAQGKLDELLVNSKLFSSIWQVEAGGADI